MTNANTYMFISMSSTYQILIPVYLASYVSLIYLIKYYIIVLCFRLFIIGEVCAWVGGKVILLCDVLLVWGVCRAD